MNPAHAWRGEVPALQKGDARPRWSVMIPTYNCAGHLRETLGSVLMQDPGPAAMQIEVVDDRSAADDPETVVHELGGTRVGFHRQRRNVGHVENFNTCLRLARGELVHLLHGDDTVEPGFYARMGDLFARHPDLGAAYCRYRIVDDTGTELVIPPADQAAAGPMRDALERIAAHQPIQPPAMVVRRSVYERIGGFDRRLTAAGEDWEMWVRVAAATPIGFEPTVLARYRVHGGSLTGRSLRTGRNIRDLRTAVALYREYLPPAFRPVTATALDKAARWALTLARRTAAAGDFSASAAQIREAVRTATTWRTRARAVTAAAWLARRRARHALGAAAPAC